MGPKVHVIYRLSDYGHGASKARPSYVGLRACFENFISNFFEAQNGDWLTVIADTVGDDTWHWVQQETTRLRSELAQGGSRVMAYRTEVGNPGSFRVSLGLAVALSDNNIGPIDGPSGGTLKNDTVVYFVEDDYIHRRGF